MLVKSTTASVLYMHVYVMEMYSGGGFDWPYNVVKDKNWSLRQFELV